jgi:hypothetical protein
MKAPHVKGYTAAGVAPRRGSPLERQAQGMIDPILAALTNSANRRARAAEQAISGYTNSYANQLGQINTEAPYDTAIGQQAATDAALQQSLTGAGTDLASQLAARLGQLQGSSGGSALAQGANNLAAGGVAAGNTELAGGSAALSSLLAHKASAGSYDAKLPGLAKLSGLQGIKQAQATAQNAIDQGTLSAESSLPTLVNDLTSQRNEQAYRNAEVQMGYGRLQIEQQNSNIAAERVAQEALNSNRSYSLSLSRLGIENKHLQLAVLKQEALYQGGGLSPSELSRYRAIAYSGATSAWAAPTAPTYQQAMTEITAKGVPVTIAAKALAQAGYKPGVRGTPRAPILEGTQTASGFKGLVPLYRQAGGAPFRRRR